jgi:Kef-type K+ transport system membrane component KefB
MSILLLLDLSLPFKKPVVVFTIILFVILFAPLILGKLRIPSIIGLILAGLTLGPYGFNVLERNASIELFGTVGLLYIMFLAGLEVDMNDFKKNRNKSIIFGFFTFSIPMIIGTLVAYYLLSFPIASAILLASMFASHTLLSYPVVSKLGLAKLQSVNVTVGGTIITDTAALLVLAVIAGSTMGELNSAFWLRLSISILVFGFLVLWGFPILGRWFFKNVNDNISQYIFVLSMVFLSAFMAELAGVEAIIGAFLAGLALNKLIPHTSPLMNRIEFVGNALFIPFFLIGVGMLVDLRVLFQGYEALIVAGAMIAVALSAKWLAALVTQKIYGYNKIERNMIFGLSSAQAAATLAAVLVGYNLKLLNENVLNGTILMILVTCLISSFVTENAARRIVLSSDVKKAENEEESPVSNQRILVPIANPNTIEQLISLALFIKDSSSNVPIFPIAVVKDSEDAAERLQDSYRMLEQASQIASATDQKTQVKTIVDPNVSNGIIRAIKDLHITDIIIGWHGKKKADELIFGSTLDNLIGKTSQMIIVNRLVQPVNTIKRILVTVPPHAEYEVGFQRWAEVVIKLAEQTSSRLLFFSELRVFEKVEQIMQKQGKSISMEHTPFEDWEDYLILSRYLKKNDLLLTITARPGSISYLKMLDRIPAYISRYFPETNIILLYPEQHGSST